MCCVFCRIFPVPIPSHSCVLLLVYIYSYGSFVIVSLFYLAPSLCISHFTCPFRACILWSIALFPHLLSLFLLCKSLCLVLNHLIYRRHSSLVFFLLSFASALIQSLFLLCRSLISLSPSPIRNFTLTSFYNLHLALDFIQHFHKNRIPSFLFIFPSICG